MSSNLPENKSLSEQPRADNLLRKEVHEVGSFAEGQISHMYELVKIGLALSSEKDIERLLEMIVSEARRFANADGGTLYIRDDVEQVLKFAIVQNETLNVRMGGSGEKITWPPVQLREESGAKNHGNVSAYCALSGKAVNIPDVYDAEGFDFQGTKDFDATTGYRSKSMLVIPMRDHEDEVIGVLQLLNAKDSLTGEVTEFPDNEVDIITSLASQAAIALTNMRLIEGLKELLDSFIRAIADAIDEKSPYTGGHIERVADLTERIAKEINRADAGRFADVSFSPEEMTELRMAAWMHDVGKITTPEYVVDKATKLETIYDRIEVVRCRIEILKRDAEIKRLKTLLDKREDVDDPVHDVSRELDEYLAFFKTVNVGGEFLEDDSIEKIKSLANLSFRLGKERVPLLSDDEIRNLTIRKGTLTGEERDVINNHAGMTNKILGNLPFPKKMRQVPAFAGMHHEKLDGSGYPRGLHADEIPIQARIVAVADVFEALTASDRPYRAGKLLSESMRILGFMVKDNHLDPDLCDVIVETGLVSKYAEDILADRQKDDFEWKGKKYILKK